MNHKGLGLVLVLIIAVAVAFAGCTSSEETPAPAQGDVPETTIFIVGIDGEYPPYSYIDSEGNPQGFDVESVRWIAENQGFEVKIQPMAWDGIIPALVNGKIDMVYSGLTITDERKEKVNFSIPYWVVNQSVAVQEDSGYTLDDFKNGTLVIGAQRGTTGQMWVEKNLIETGLMSKDNLKTYDNFPLVAEDLKNGRLDAAIYDKPPMLDAIAGKPIVIVGEINTGEEYGVAIRKGDVDLLNSMNEGITTLMADPYWEELKIKYEMAE
ncbi:basic amino acid ABC transporter substrate-binding protein [Methanogenium organophilum]|uniref:Basic amino acid ABC transporter substrate-binding protein n=1 Tax=Methanogenium organophilum TaxID=2199 RepID=A0A9X9T6X0_METOG|nr:basic amino acid ABC transporter substrate-binding protein [Methanogenium organophilum]WAI00758.1 basic amino acid ABC transporter substrate-binding protein [Methanogenium organophilum]